MTVEPDPEMLARAERFANLIAAECDDYQRRNMPAEYSPGMEDYMRTFTREHVLTLLQEHEDAALNRVFVLRPSARG